ncbi:hypothetical protein Glove_130g32 [Diversispora epigaea]|uniref:Uncharacterized protein n=1 Tax=Diversispora epigaea TaxID=1348612 RepID=A0A397J1Y1_9GLOM|nr:hypothetical protein Glove_130g32 [Diversispora epigaea]
MAPLTHSTARRLGLRIEEVGPFSQAALRLLPDRRRRLALQQQQFNIRILWNGLTPRQRGNSSQAQVANLYAELPSISINGLPVLLRENEMRQINGTKVDDKFSLVDCIRGLVPGKIKALLGKNIRDTLKYGKISGNRKKREKKERGNSGLKDPDYRVIKDNLEQFKESIIKQTLKAIYDNGDLLYGGWLDG